MKYTPKELKESNSWIEKGMPKHKHDFTIPCIYEQRLEIKPNRDNIYQISYYEVNMCNSCRSFVVDDKHDGHGGCIGTVFSNDKKTLLSNTQNNLPRIVGIHYNKYCNINYVNKLYFPDGTNWEKK